MFLARYWWLKQQNDAPQTFDVLCRVIHVTNFFPVHLPPTLFCFLVRQGQYMFNANNTWCHIPSALLQHVLNWGTILPAHISTLHCMYVYIYRYYTSLWKDTLTFKVTCGDRDILWWLDYTGCITGYIYNTNLINHIQIW